MKERTQVRSFFCWAKHRAIVLTEHPNGVPDNSPGLRFATLGTCVRFIVHGPFRAEEIDSNARFIQGFAKTLTLGYCPVPRWGTDSACLHE